MSATVEILRRARARIASPETWTTFAMARTAAGGRSQPRSPNAASWCLSGAIEAVASNDDECETVRRAMRDRVGGPLSIFNDSHTHAEVLAALDHAIAAESSKP